MAESLFSEIFEKKEKGKNWGGLEPSPEEGAASGQKALSSEPNRGTLADLEQGFHAKLAELQAELAKERERSLTYDIRIKEMQSARREVEDLFEKLAAKAAKEKLEHGFEVIREKALARTEVLEQRLDEFQKAMVELAREISLRPSEAAQVRVDFEAKIRELSENLEGLLKEKKSLESTPKESFQVLEAALDQLKAEIGRLSESFKSQLEKLKEDEKNFKTATVSEVKEMAQSFKEEKVKQNDAFHQELESFHEAIIKMAAQIASDSASILEEVHLEKKDIESFKENLRGGFSQFERHFKEELEGLHEERQVFQGKMTEDFKEFSEKMESQAKDLKGKVGQRLEALEREVSSFCTEVNSFAVCLNELEQSLSLLRSSVQAGLSQEKSILPLLADI